MGFKTVSGLTPSEVSPSGLTSLANGQPFDIQKLLSTLSDLQSLVNAIHQKGVLAGTISVNGLGVAFASGFKYHAGMTWATDTNVQVLMSANTNNWLWGCSDGVIRVTQTNAAPGGYQSCLLCTATTNATSATVTPSTPITPVP